MFDRLLCILAMLAAAASAAPLAAQTASSPVKLAQNNSGQPTAKSPAQRRKPSPAAKPKKKIKKIVLTGVCADYHKERAALEAEGVRDTLKKDAAVAAPTMSQQDLDNVRRLITLDEKLMFECRVINRQVVFKKPKAVQTVDAGAVPALPTRRPKRASSPKSNVSPVVPLPTRSER